MYRNYFEQSMEMEENNYRKLSSRARISVALFKALEQEM